MPQIALKLKATGGGKCNLTNTLSQDDFFVLNLVRVADS